MGIRLPLLAPRALPAVLAVLGGVAGGLCLGELLGEDFGVGDLAVVSVDEACRGDVFTAVVLDELGVVGRTAVVREELGVVGRTAVVREELGVVGRTEVVRVELGVVGRGPGDWCLAAVARLMCAPSPVLLPEEGFPRGVVLPDGGSLGLASRVGVVSLLFLVVIVVSFRP